MWTNELLVALGQDVEGYTVFGYAQEQELTASVTRMRDGGQPARSLAEMGKRGTEAQAWVLRLKRGESA
jgi:hypothetical protein